MVLTQNFSGVSPLPPRPPLAAELVKWMGKGLFSIIFELLTVQLSLFIFAGLLRLLNNCWSMYGLRLFST